MANDQVSSAVMSSIEDLRKKRNQPNGNNSGIIGNGQAYHTYNTANSAQGGHPNQYYYDHNNNLMSHLDGMASLNQGFNGLNVSSVANNKASPALSSQASDFGGVPLASHIPQTFMHNGQVMFTGHYLPHGVPPHQSALPPSPGMYTAFGPQFFNQQGFPTYPHLFNSNSPVSQWTSSRVPSSEMPTLVSPRRDSSSSNENDLPTTPFTQYTASADGRTIIPVFERSPNSPYSWGTPSTTAVSAACGIVKPRPVTDLDPHLIALTLQEPAIPQAVPASFSPQKPLDRCLENRNGVTNVYIRGLQPNTSDDMLYKLASRFGDIVSSKSIIDRSSGRCKGFGFVRYHSYKDAEDCIRTFHYMGYETSFARESFYSQLKKLSDEQNTNLYVSNLPMEMNEHELEALFHPHKVCSCRILRDEHGNGRGVGFARFESREVCEEIIKKFLDAPANVGAKELHNIQIRYADTPDQKTLKQQTAAARQYRTAEYEFQTTGRRSFPDQTRAFGSPSSDFESYMTSQTGISPNVLRARPLYHRLPARDRLSSLSSHLTPKNGRSIGNGNHSPLAQAESIPTAAGGVLDPNGNETITIKIEASDKTS